MKAENNDPQTESKKLRLRIIAVIRTIILVFFSLIILISFLFVIKTVLNPSEVPSLGRYYLMTVESGSMAPAIETGDMILMKRTEYPDPQEAVGKIIAFHSGKYIVTHRVTRVEKENGQAYFYTQGDANNTVDKDPIREGDMIGEYVLRIKGAGKIIWLLQTPAGMIGFVMLFLSWGAVEILRTRKKQRRGE